MSDDDPGGPSSPAAAGDTTFYVAGLASYDLASLAAKLPTGRDAESKKARRSIFRRIDVSGHGVLSLSDARTALARAVGIDHFAEAQPALERAFLAARDASKCRSEGLEPDGFYLMLVYMRQYFELFAAFHGRDAAFNGQLSVSDYKQGLDLLAKYGTHLPYAEVEAAFEAIDVAGSGSIAFGEHARPSPPAGQRSTGDPPQFLPSR
jgi:hypothetical protein